MNVIVATHEPPFVLDRPFRWREPRCRNTAATDPTEPMLFSTECTLGYAAGDTNLYRYCGNSPTSHTDPSGLVWGWAFAGAGAAIGSGTYLVGSWFTGSEVTWGGLAGAAAGGAMAGFVVGALSGDVTSFGGAVLVGATAGAAAGATGSVVRQAVDTGSVDLGQVGVDTAAGALGGAVTGGIMGPGGATLGTTLLAGAAGGGTAGAIAGAGHTAIQGGDAGDILMGAGQGAFRGVVYGTVGAGMGYGAVKYAPGAGAAILSRAPAGMRSWVQTKTLQFALEVGATRSRALQYELRVDAKAIHAQFAAGHARNHSTVASGLFQGRRAYAVSNNRTSASVRHEAEQLGYYRVHGKQYTGRNQTDAEQILLNWATHEGLLSPYRTSLIAPSRPACGATRQDCAGRIDMGAGTRLVGPRKEGTSPLLNPWLVRTLWGAAAQQNH